VSIRPRESLIYDDAAERSYARLRGVSALVMLPAAVLLILRGGLLGKLLGLTGALVGLLWLRRAARAPKRPAVTRIDVTDEALLLHMGTVLREIRFANIERIDADEDNLVVRITMREGEHVDLPPGYEKLGVSALAERLRKASDRSRGHHA
jgi:hypothetical protein